MQRHFLYVFFVSILLTFAGCTGGNGGSEDDTDIDSNDLQSQCDGDCFPNGVAAGDVDHSSVVLWTRASFVGKGTVRFEYGRDPDFIVTPDGSEDIEVAESTVPAKFPVTGLLPGTQYHYRVCRDSCPAAFPSDSEARGNFRTPHLDGKHGLRFGVSSCWRGDMKPFVAIKNVPNRNLDFFVALGDTIYADSRASGGPAKTLSGFRNKYDLAFKRLKTSEQNELITGSPIDDNYFAQARASTAFYVGIDDHEVINNWAGGAGPQSQINTKMCNRKVGSVAPDGVCFCDPDFDNDNVDYEVDDPLRDPNCFKENINETDLYDDALRAWHEYNPVEDDEYYGDTGDDLTKHKKKLYRYRTFGTDAAIFMLDTRSFRHEEALLNTYAENRTMLGKAQLDDLLQDLSDAESKGITWKFVLVPQPIQNMGLAGAGDRFEGYAYERRLILEYIEANCIANVVFISGDIHSTLVNNLTYKEDAIGLQRASTAWDISTGPVAYSGQGISAPGPTGTTITRAGEGEPRLPLDIAFQVAMDTQLGAQNRPLTGLGFELYSVPPLQGQNRFVPVIEMEGSYVAGHSFGWSEFEIEAGTQNLLVKTYGIDWYDSPVGSAYTDAKLAEIHSRDRYLLHQFKVAPRTGCPACGDGICDANAPLLEQCGGNDTTLLQCRSDCGRCGNGEPCGDNNMCESGLCSGDIAGVCIFPQENGQPCTKDEACTSGLCNLGFCMDPQPDNNPCRGDDACISGICTAGFCAACKTGGSVCLSGSACCSGGCDSGFCKAESCKSRGARCSNDWECCSFDFNACSGLPGNKTCK